MNELKIFDIVPEGFFTPLSSGNKKIYSGLAIKQVFNITKDIMSGLKS